MAEKNNSQVRNNVNYILGVDGGASKTIACLINLTTKEQWQASAGPSSLTNDLSGAVTVLNSLVNEVIKQAGCELSEVVTVFGLAGAGNKLAVAKLQKKFLHRFNTLDIYSDATTSAYGANNGSEVAVVALGTGSVGMRLQLNEQGELISHLVGGWGFLIDDEGGGAKLGFHSVQALVREFQHLGYAHSKLARAIADHINAKGSSNITRQEITAWVAKAKPVDFAKLSPLVIKHQFECPVADKIIHNHVVNVETLITDTRADSKLPVVLLGGLAPLTQKLLSTETKKFLLNAKGDALDGACLLANLRVQNSSARK